MCNKCLDGLDIEYESRHDLDPSATPDEDLDLGELFDFGEEEDD